MGNRNRFLAIAVVIGGSLFVLLLFFILGRSGPSKEAGDPLATTTITSPLTKSTDKLAVNYGADGGNLYTVKQQFRIFALDSLPFTDSTKAELEALLPEAIGREAVPTYALSYIHIDKQTVACSSNSACNFSFYIDSPEMYFDFRMYRDTAGGLGYTLQERAWKGVAEQ